MRKKYAKALPLVLVFIALLSIAATPFFYRAGLEKVDAVTGYMNGAFPTTLSSDLEWVAYDSTAIVDVLTVRRVPNTNTIALGAINGTIRFYDFDTNSVSDVLWDIAPEGGFTNNSGRTGLKGLAFHPEYGDATSPNANYVYLTSLNNDNKRKLSRYTINSATGILDRETELVMIELLGPGNSYHTIGEIGFGGDGFLYVPIGDGDGGGSDAVIPDVMNYVQEIEGNLVGGVLRIDVDRDPTKSHPPVKKLPQTFENEVSGVGYFIPNDNPWPAPNGEHMEEYYTIGHRNPWKLTVDPLNGNVWIDEVGPYNGEEINLLKGGHNYGWPYRVGPTGEIDWDRDPPTAPEPDPYIGVLTEPIYSPERDDFKNSLIGTVYRGSKWPEYYGKIMFADIAFKNVRMVGFDEATEDVSVDTLPAIARSYALFESPLGDIMGISTTGELFALARSENNSDVLPQLLSQVGAFSSLQPLEPNGSLIPYTVNTPLWSDRAEKERWVVLPHNGDFDTAAEKIVFAPDSPWEFPAGTVFIKHFKLALDERNTKETRPLETRFIIVGENGSTYGITYRWLPDGSDAELLLNGAKEDFNITDTDGGAYRQTWHYPGTNECLNCHNTNAGQSLGVNTQQLNGNYRYHTTGITDNQLHTWNSLDIFDADIGAPEAYIKNAGLNDTNAGDELKVRSYLDANCAYCHMPGGVDAAFDARITTPLSAQGLIDQNAVSAASHNALIVASGDYLGSELYERDNSVGANAMPPLAKTMVDEDYMRVLLSWIMGLKEGQEAIGEVGVAHIDHEYHTIALKKRYTDPVIITGAPTVNGGQQTTVRIDNVTGNSFQVRLDEWSCMDGTHYFEDVPYIVVEAGVHRLANGKLLQAGNLEMVGGASSFERIDFPVGFGATPIAFSQAITERETETICMRIDHNTLSTKGMAVRMSEQDGDSSGHIGERVSWLAIEPAVTANGTRMEVGKTSRTYRSDWKTIAFQQAYDTEAPIFIGALGSNYGGNAAVMRQNGLTSDQVLVYIEEEACGDPEIDHIDEVVHYMVFEGKSILVGATLNDLVAAQGKLDMFSVDREAILVPNPVRNGNMLTLTWRSYSEAVSELKVISAAGRIVQHLSVRTQLGENQFQFSTERLPSGLYMLHVKQQGYPDMIKKVIVD